MRSAFWLPTGLIALALHLPAAFGASAEAPLYWVAPIRGTIDPATSAFLRDTIQRAVREQASGVIVELDTPGGLVSSVREMAQNIESSPVPVIVHVTPGGASATSAGALLLFASHLAAMAPGTHLGAAHPVGAQGEDIQGTMKEKAESDTAAFARSLAHLRGRNVGAAESVVLKSRSFTAEEAQQSKLVEVIANDRDALLKSIQGLSVSLHGKTRVLQTEQARIQQAEMNTGQRLLHFFANPNIAALLMSLGMLLIYLELSAPGIGFAGVLGALCLILAFMAFQMLPIQVGGLILLVIGAGLLIAEPFVITHGAFAVGGSICFALGLLWIVDPNKTDLRVSHTILIAVSLVLSLFAITLAAAARRTKRLTEKTRAQIGGAGISGLSGYLGHVESITGDGKRGKAVFRGELWDFESEVPLQRGESIQAMEARGMVVKVSPASKPHS